MSYVKLLGGLIKSQILPQAHRANAHRVNDSHANHTHLCWLSGVRDGYQREHALKMLLADDAPVTNSLWHVLLARQNDYVLPVRRLALAGLLKLLTIEHLPSILMQMDKFWHLKNQSRSAYDVIFEQLKSLFLAQDAYPVVLNFLKKQQGNAVRALYIFLVDICQISPSERINIALSSPDIVICQMTYTQALKAPKDTLLSWLTLDYPKPLKIKNRQFYAKLLIHVIKKYPQDDWQVLAVNYLAYATKSQSNHLLWLLRQKGLDNLSISALILASFAQKNARHIILNLIYYSKDVAWMLWVVCQHPDWQQTHAEHIYALCVLLLLEYSAAQSVIENPPDTPMPFYIKKAFFDYHQVRNLSDFERYGKLLALSDNEYCLFSRHLATWDLLFWLINYIQAHKDSANALFLQAVQRARIRFGHADIYTSLLRPDEKDWIKAQFHQPNVKKQLAELIVPLTCLKIL